MAAAVLRKRGRPSTGEQNGLDQRNEFVAGRCAQKSHSRIGPVGTFSTLCTLSTLCPLGTLGTLGTLGSLMIQIFNRDRGNPIDAVLPRPVAVQDEVYLLDRDLVGQRRSLIETLLCLWSRLG